jgi:hypothetical protein
MKALKIIRVYRWYRGKEKLILTVPIEQLKNVTPVMAEHGIIHFYGLHGVRLSVFLR